MTSDNGASRTIDDVRDYLLRQLNSALRRPGMYGGESALRLFLDAVAFVDGGEQLLADDLTELREREAFVVCPRPEPQRSLCRGRATVGTPRRIQPAFPKTFAYGTAHGASVTWPSAEPESLLLATRYGEARSVDRFAFTPKGAARRERLASRQHGSAATPSKE